jgi:hypothetical protein
LSWNDAERIVKKTCTRKGLVLIFSVIFATCPLHRFAK